MKSRPLRPYEFYSFQVAYFGCNAIHRHEHGDVEVRVRAGDNYYCRFLCKPDLTIDEIKVYIAKKIRETLSHTMDVVTDYIAYWSDPNVPTT